MSCGLILQTQNDIFIAADTATSVKVSKDLNRLDDVYRKDTNARKLFTYDNMVIFCTGDLALSYKIMDIFDKSDKQITTLRDIAKKNFISKFGNDMTLGKLDIMVATFEDGESVVYQISPYNLFEIVDHRIPTPNNFAFWAGGIMVDEALEIAFKEFASNLNVIQTFKKTYDEISFEGVGGDLIIYHLTPSYVKQVYEQPIKEKELRYVDYKEIMSKLLGDVSVQAVNAQIVRGVLGEFCTLKADRIIVNDDGSGMSEIGVKMTHANGSYTNLTYDGLMRYTVTPIYNEVATGVPDTEDFNGEDLVTLTAKGWEFSANVSMNANRLQVGSESSYTGAWARINKYITKDNTTFNFSYSTSTNSDDDHYFYIDNNSYDLGITGTVTTFQATHGGTITLTKGWHTFLWHVNNVGTSTSRCEYIDDIIFEQNPVRLEASGTSTTTGTTYNYLTYSGTGSTPNSMIFSNSEAVPDVYVQLPDEFKGKNFKITLSLKDTGVENNDYTLSRIILDVVGTIDYTNARFKVHCSTQRMYYSASLYKAPLSSNYELRQNREYYWKGASFSYTCIA